MIKRITVLLLRQPHGPAGFPQDLHVVPAAYEIAREVVGGFAGELVRVGVGLRIDIGDVADGAGRQPGHRAWGAGRGHGRGVCRAAAPGGSAG